MTLENPYPRDTLIQACLRSFYGLQIRELDFRSSGDINSAVYRAVAENNDMYFLKLRTGNFEETSITVARFLYDQGIQHIIPPLETVQRELWATLDGFKVILYPYIDGQNAFERPLNELQWAEFGAILRAIHTTDLPYELKQQLEHEKYSSQWRDKVTRLQERTENAVIDDPNGRQWAQLFRDRAQDIHHFVRRVEQLGSILQHEPPELVLCHSDLHAGNLLVGGNDRLYIVDWDNPILAPKERDLMFIGGGVGTHWYSVKEETQFYAGYGETQINPIALAYYRFERIIEDMASFGEQVFSGTTIPARWVEGFQRWFTPNDVVERAYKAEEGLPPELLQSLPH